MYERSKYDKSSSNLMPFLRKERKNTYRETEGKRLKIHTDVFKRERDI